MGEVLYAPVTSRKAQGRGADRRRGAPALLQSVISALATGPGSLSMRQRFEHELKGMVRARTVALYDGPSVGPSALGATSFEVPGLTPGRGARIDVTFEPGRTLDGWTCELLDAATHVAALVLEMERASGRPPQFARIRRDGAAPLVGSSRAMRDGARADRAGRRDADSRPHRRRIGHRQGAGRAADPRAESAGARGRSSRSTAPRSSKRCSKRSCSGSRIARRPACAAAAASSSTRTTARCSSTRCRTSRRPRRRSCCARSRTCRSSASAAPAPRRSTSASSSATNQALSALVAAAAGSGSICSTG